MRLRLCFVLIFVTLMTGCTLSPSHQPIFEAKTSISTLKNLYSWEIQGVVAVKNSADSVTATLNWQQLDSKSYRIHLLGPLGTGSYQLIGKPGRVELVTSGGKHFYATTPEQLLLQQTGWALPISNLYYWIRGLAAPSSTAKQSFSANGRLSELLQQGWTIKYLRYKLIKGLFVPDKIFLNNEALNVKIVINQWNF